MHWDCQDCSFAAWGQTRESVEHLIGRHIVDHHRETLRDVDVGVAWSCPYCASTGYKTRYQTAVRGFRGHIRDQHTDRFDILDLDIGTALDGGGILIDAPPASDEAGTAISYFHALVTASIVITSRPVAHIAHLDQQPTVMPENLSFVTTASLDDAEFETDSLTLDSVTVERPEDESLAALGEAISLSLQEFENDRHTVCIEVDILQDMLGNFGAATVSQFASTLCDRAKRSDTLVYFFLDTEGQPDTTVETFEQISEITLTATEEGLVQTGLPDGSSFL